MGQAIVPKFTAPIFQPYVYKAYAGAILEVPKSNFNIA